MESRRVWVIPWEYMGMRRAFLISCILSVGCFKKPNQELLVVVEVDRGNVCTQHDINEPPNINILNHLSCSK